MRVVTECLAIIGMAALMLFGFAAYSIMVKRKSAINQKDEVVDKTVDKVVDKEEGVQEEVENEYPRLLLVGLPYRQLDEPRINHLMNSLTSGFKERLNVNAYTTDANVVEFLWFEHSRNTAAPYPEADKVLKEKGTKLASRMMNNYENAWQVGQG